MTTNVEYIKIDTQKKKEKERLLIYIKVIVQLMLLFIVDIFTKFVFITFLNMFLFNRELLTGVDYQETRLDSMDTEEARPDTTQTAVR